MIYRRRAVALVVVVLASTSLAAVARADTATVADAAGDVDRSESGAFASEPRVDITEIEIRHEARELRVAVTVDRFTPVDDDAWLASLALEVVLVDDEDDAWFWSFLADGGGGAVGSLLSVSGEEVVECETEATASAAQSAYILTAGPECLRDVPRSVRVGVAMSYDADPFDDDFDTPFDVAPDDDFTAPIDVSDGPAVARIAGADRVETAIALSADRFDGAEAPSAVLVASTAAADAVTGGPLAAARGGPLLLTGGTGLDQRVGAELDRALTPGSDVFLLGGTGVLTDALLADVRDRGFRARRLAGTDRYATAVAVAEEIGAHDIVLIADGGVGAEGLIAGAAAAALGGVVVLSDGASLPPATDAFLADDASRHIAIGTAATAAPGAERVTASDAPELSRRVLDRLLPDVSMLAVAGFDGSADALTGAPHLASRGGGLLLTDGRELSAATGAALTARAGELREVALYGGTAALDQRVADAVTAAVR